jgi:hypothetical protein
MSTQNKRHHKIATGAKGKNETKEGRRLKEGVMLEVAFN